MCCYKVIDITRFAKYSDSNLNFNQNLVQYFFKNMSQRESYTRSFTVILFTNLHESEFHRLVDCCLVNWPS